MNFSSTPLKMFFSYFLVVLLLLGPGVNSQSLKKLPDVSWDANGYVFYCPCHGRFGNQADQFLGSLHFAKALNRTLILPPWRNYDGKRKMIPFNEYFQVEPLREYHRVILAADFMHKLAPKYWPKSQRIAFCHNTNTEKYCPLDGEFFAEFWRFVGVDYLAGVDSIEGLSMERNLAAWNNRFPPVKFPVILLRGPPSTYPVSQDHWPLQKYLQWSPKIAEKAEEFIWTNFYGEPFMAIHLRQGSDWIKACKLLEDNTYQQPNLMASPQCLGSNPETSVTMKMCLPTSLEVRHTIRRTLKTYKTRNLFLATDDKSFLDEFRLNLPDVYIVDSGQESPQVDLYIMAKSGIFIGNCVSSFTSFVRRSREVLQKPTLYFGFDASANVTQSKRNPKHDEL